MTMIHDAIYTHVGVEMGQRFALMLLLKGIVDYM